MVRLLCGEKGTGKTKRLIEMANTDSKSVSGDIIFIEESNKHILDLNHEIRFINAMEFDIKDIETFHGFLCGIIAEDYDAEKIYINRLYKIIDLEFDIITELVSKLEKLGEKFNVDFVMGVRCKESELPESLKTYILK